MRHFVIGDIHGCLTTLKTLIESLDVTNTDTIITLGDYIDRGPDSKGVIDYLIELRRKYRVINLKGNHEEMMEHARETPEDLEFWLKYGGRKTLESFGVDNIKKISGKYWGFFVSCYQYHETGSHIFVHAGLKPDVILKRQHPNHLFWQRIKDTPPHISGKTIICGHTPQASGLPLVLDHLVCIDTFAFDGLWLTCMSPETGEYWQANHLGETRKGVLDDLRVIEAG
ncbi:MAG: metallophosphoesterase family protein [Akkermansiaceae bacterium]